MAGLRADIDDAVRYLASDEPEIDSSPDFPAWLTALAVLLRQSGWAWPQSQATCMWAVLQETGRAGRRGAVAIGQGTTGVPTQTWSALSLLVAGSGPGCQPEHRWPGVPRIYSAGGVNAVRESDEVLRVVKLAVAGKAARSGRKAVRSVSAA